MADSNSHPTQTETQAYQFLDKMQALQEVSLELFRANSLEELYRRAVELGRSRLGFDRLGLLLYDEAENLMRGAFGTDEQGNLRDERDMSLLIEDEHLLEILHSPERIGYVPEAGLDDYGQEVGQGWRAISALWSGERGIGWLAADNLLNHEPVTYHLDILKLYGATLGHLISQKQAEQVARQGDQALLSSLLNSIPDLIFYKDVAGVYLGCNVAFAEFVGRPADEIVGHTDFELFPQEVAAFFREQDEQMMAQGQARRNEEWVDYPDGRRALLDTLKTPFYDAGHHLLGLIGISRDVTAVHQSQADILRLGYVVEQSLDGTAVASLDGLIQFVNPAWAAMHGYTPDELVGQHLSIFHTPEQLSSEVEPANRQVMETGEAQRGEIGHVRRDGSTFPTLMTINLLKDSSGQSIGFVAAAQDITERKVAEQGLRESENRYRQILDAITQMVLVKGEKSRILWANKAFRNYYGMDNETLQGLIDAPFNEPDYTLQYIRDDAYVFDTGQVLEIPEEPVTRHDGYIGLFQTIKSPIFDENGQVIATVGVSDEITARKAAEAELRENQARLSQANQVVENSPVILFRWRADENWSVEYVSENIARFGYTREELLTGETPYANLVHPDDLARVAQEVGDYSASGVEQFTQEYRIITKDKQVRWTDDRTVIIRDDTGQITHYQGIVIDITERKAAEETLARSAVELETVARVSAAASTILETDKLLQEVVDLTKSQFGLYHAHIYLLDEESQQLVLTAGSGEVGHQMVASGRAIPLDHPHSLVARAARARQAAIVNDVRQNADFLPNPLLPDTRAELAVPMTIGDRLIGVFDVQADTEDYFTEQNVQTQNTLAAQVAVALQNARLFEERQRASALLQERLKELDCLSDIGRKMGEQPAVPELFEWVANRLPAALQEPELAVAAVEFAGQTYGAADAAALPRQIVQSLRVEGETVGRIILAYTKPIYFLDEESALLGDVARRLSGYIESHNLNLALSSERRTLRAVLDSAPAGIFVAEAPSGNPLLANEQAAEMLGRGLLPDVERESLAEVYDAYLYGTDEPYPVERLPLVRSMSGESSRVDDMEVRRPDGKRILLEVTGAPVYDEAGEVNAGIIIFQDITERKKGEEDLRQRETRFSSLVSNIPGAVYRCAYDADFTMQFLSDIIEEMTGYPSDDFIDNRVRSYASLVHPEDSAALDSAILEAVEQRRAYSAEYRLLRADGDVAWVYEKGQAVYDEQGTVLWLDGAIFDITERKRTEEMMARRAVELEAVAEVSTAVSTILQTDELLQTVVDLTQSRFALYHAHIYLLSARGDSLELAAGAGEIGRQMMAQGRSIPLNLEQSLVAQAGRSRHSRVVNNVRLSPDWLPNPLLPDTQSEMAIPILLGEQLLGVLDVQADELDYFTPEDERIQTTLAAQVAIALENARSFEQSRRAVEELNALTRQLTREGWSGYREQMGGQELGYVYDNDRTTPILPLADRGWEEVAMGENGRSLAQSLVIHGEPIGQLTIFDEAWPATGSDSLAEAEAAEIIAAVAEQLSARLENLRLTEQTQIALAETAEQAERLSLLNQIAQVISQTIERDQMLEAVYQQMGRVLELDAFHVGLYDAAAQTLHYPILYEANERQDPITVSLRPESNSYRVIHTGEAVLRHLSQEELDQVLAGQTQSLPGQAGYATASLLFAPLRAGQQMLGVISAQSYRQNAYGEADLQLISGIAGYVAVALENATLFANTQQRAATLQRLSEIETALSLAQTEDEIVAALISHLPQGKMLAATLGYLEQVADPALHDDSLVSLVSLWISGQFSPEALAQFQDLPLSAYPSTYLWQQNTFTPTLVRDVLAEGVAPPLLREQAMSQGWRSIALLPLRSGGRWQGLISINWSDVQEFTEDDAFLLNRLMEPVAAVVASRRAQLAQQAALQETEALYTVTTSLNAANTYEDILATLQRHTVLGRSAQNVSLNYFDRPWTAVNPPETVFVLARYSELDPGLLRPEYRVADFPAITSMLHPDSMTVLEDVANAEGVDENSRRLYAQVFGAKSTIFAPLVVGGQWIGYLNSIYQQPMRFSEADLRRLMALAGQAAIAIQGIRLLETAEKRAQREQMLREITARVRSSADVDTIMKTAVQEIGLTLGRKALIYLGDEYGA
jgi:PAS domain S-box-containing protein